MNGYLKEEVTSLKMLLPYVQTAIEKYIIYGTKKTLIYAKNQ